MSGEVKQNRPYLGRALCALALLASAGCATSQKGKILEWTAIGATLGGAYGASRPDYQDKNSMMFGALGAVAGAIAGLYYHDPDKQSEKLVLENQKLKRELDLIQSPNVLIETPATFNAKIPDKYKKLINPGEWKISEIDQWIEDSENRLIHQDKIMELIPPSLNPYTKELSSPRPNGR